MIVTRAPFRVSLFGGGTDFESYFQKFPSKILSFSINKYIYVIAKKRDDKFIYINYSRKEISKNIKLIKHDIVRETLKYFNINFGIEISIISDIPSKGSGLGSSSALANALILAISKLNGKNLTQKEICKIAIEIEIKILKKPIGIQDQYGTAIGGIKIISMNKSGIQIKKIKNKKLLSMIQDNSIIFDTRKSRKAEEILKKQKNLIKKNLKKLDNIREISMHIIKNIKKIDLNLFIFNLNKSWQIKKNLEKKVSNNYIENKILYLKKHNYHGFKLCGAGKGGFIFATSMKKNKSDDERFKNIKVDNEGVKIMFFDKIT